MTKTQSAMRYTAMFLVAAIIGYTFETTLKAITHAPNNTLVFGPYHIIYGLGLCFAFFICERFLNRGWNKWWAILVIAVALNVFEFLGGLVFNTWLGLALWDYSNLPLNIMGNVWIGMSLVWVGFALLYTLWLHGKLKEWLSPKVCDWIIISSVVIIIVFDIVKTALS